MDEVTTGHIAGDVEIEPVQSGPADEKAARIVDIVLTVHGRTLVPLLLWRHGCDGRSCPLWGIDGRACKEFRRDSFDVSTAGVARTKLRDLGGGLM
jgi:hypothetical protein